MKVISLFVAFQSPLVVCGLVLLAQSSIYHPCCAISFNSLLTLLELGRHSNVWKQRLGLFCLVEHRGGFKGLLRGSAAAQAFAVILGGVHVSWCVTNDVPRSSWTFPADVSPTVAVTAAAPFGRVWAWATGFCFWGRKGQLLQYTDSSAVQSCSPRQ